MYQKLFYEILRELGYDREEELIDPPPTLKHPMEVAEGNYSATFLQFVSSYPNKDSYCYTAFVDDLQINGLNKPQLKHNLSELCKDIKFEEPSRVHELGFQFKSEIHQSEMPKRVRYKMLMQFFRRGKADVANATWGTERGEDGDTIIVYPYGDKDYKTWLRKTIALGTKQRQSMAKQWGFGSLSEEGNMYATFREGELHPWKR